MSTAKHGLTPVRRRALASARAYAASRRPFQVASVVLIALLSIAFFTPDENLVKQTIVCCLAVFYTLLIRAFARPVTVVPGLPSLLSVESLFLVFYFLLFYKPYQSYVLFDDPLSYSEFFRDTYPKFGQQAIILSTIGLLAFCLGVDGPRRREQMVEKRQPVSRVSAPPSLIDLALLIFLGASVVFYISMGFANANEARYTGGAVGGSAANIYDLIVLFCVMIVARTGFALRRRSMTPVLVTGAVIVAVWALRLLIAGDRNNFFLIATAGVAVVGIYIVRLRLVVLVGMMVGALILYNAVEVVRVKPSASVSEIYNQIISGEPDQQESGDSSFSTTTVTVRAAIAVVPAKVPWGKGKYKALGLMGIVPFLRGIVLPNGADTTADVLTRYILGRFANWGVGSSIIADCYMDFGVPGVIALLYLIGWLGFRIQRAAIADPWSPSTQVPYIIAVAYFSEYPRYGFEFPVNALVWGAGLLYGLALISPKPKQTIQHVQ